MKKKKFIFEKKVSEKLSWGLSDPRKKKFRSKEDFMPGGKSGPGTTDYNWSTDTETDKTFDMKDMEQMQRAYNQEKEYQALSPLSRMFTSRPDSFRKGSMDQDFYWNQARSDDATYKKSYSPTGVEGGKPAAPSQHYINKADIKDVTTPLSKDQLAAFGMSDNWRDKVAKAGMEDAAQDEWAGRDPATNWTAAKRMASKKLSPSELPKLEMDDAAEHVNPSTDPGDEEEYNMFKSLQKKDAKWDGKERRENPKRSKSSKFPDRRKPAHGKPGRSTNEDEHKAVRRKKDAYDDHGDFVQGLRGAENLTMKDIFTGPGSFPRAVKDAPGQAYRYLRDKFKGEPEPEETEQPVSDYWNKWMDKRIQAKKLQGESVRYNFKKIQEGMINGYGFTGESHDDFVARMSEAETPEEEHKKMPGTRGIDNTIPNMHSDTAREKDDGDYDEYDLFDLEGHLGKAHVVGTDGQDKVLKVKKTKTEGMYSDVDFNSREGFTMSLSNVINEKKFKDRKRDYRKIGATTQEGRIGDAFEGYPESDYYRRVIKEGDKFVLYVSRKDKSMTKTKYPKDLYDFANQVMENHRKNTKKSNKS